MSFCCISAVDEPTGDFYLFTKDRENSISEVYRYPYPQSVDNNPYTLGNLFSMSVFPQFITLNICCRACGDSAPILDHRSRHFT